MKKHGNKLLAMVLSLTLLLSMIPAMTFSASAADGPYSGGKGTEKDPYKISSRDDLKAIADAVNGGDDLSGVYFEQTKDLDLGGESNPWPVIGHVIGNTPHPFNGVYNGGDCKIFGLFVASGTDEDGEPVGVENEDAGLFGHVGKDGIIRRVHVVDCKVYNKSLYVGGIAGRNEGLVEYCSSDATDPDNSSGVIKGSWQYAGGIVGYNFGKISYCYSNCDVLGAQKVGGITGGQNGGTVVNCYFRGYIYADDITRAYAGGIAGENDGNSTIDNCYSDSTVEGRNDNAYCGAIAGSNDTGSTVGNCFWEDSEETGVPGIGSGMGDVENVEQRTEEEFSSGQVAWELSKGTDGDGWGQTLEDEDGNHDNHPHFTQAPDKDYDTTAVYRVTLKALSINIDETLFVDPDVDIDLTLPKYKLEYPAQWYVVDENGDGVLGDDGLPLVFTGNVTNHDVDAVGGKRILFAGEAETVTVTETYSTAEQKLAIDLDQHMGYAESGSSVEGRFEYTILEDKDNLNAVLNIDGKSLTIPEGTNVKEGGYTLTVNAHEKAPLIAPLSLGEFGADDVTLTVNIVIEKATPVITVKPQTSDIDYGKTLANSSLNNGEAQHPTTGVIVEGTFAWNDSSTVPTVNEAAITGYPVTFTPNDILNYNTVTTMIPLTVNMVDPYDVVAPTAVNSVYNGRAENLIKGGSAEGGTMKYWLTDDPNAEPPADNSEFSSTIPSRANVGTYYIWYKVIGDENHNDTDPKSISATISPYPLEITDQHFSYNGTNTFTLELEGVEVEGEDNSRTVIATLTASNKDAGDYEYAADAESGKYTVDLSNSNYVVAEGAGTLTIDKLAAIFSWSDELTFTYDGDPHEVFATVSNAVDGDKFDLKYEKDGEQTNIAEDADDYVAEVTELGNSNYTLAGAQNVTQAWYITPENENITLSADDSITYGEQITITADIAPIIAPVANVVTFNGRAIHLMSIAAADKVDFFINGNLFDSVEVNYYDDDKESGTATLTIDAATADNCFSAGVNAVKAEYGGNDNVFGAESAALTVNVSAKPIAVTINGNTDKTYDGNNIAAGFDISLNSAEICGKDEVTVTADTYTYNSADAEEAETITANNVTLLGAQSSNYVISDDSVTTLNGKINPKTVGLEWRGATGLVYSGNPVNVNATAVELIPGFDCGVNVEGGKETDVDDYTAEAVSLDNSNYALPADGTTQDYTISPAPLYIPEQTVSYDGDTAELEVELDGVTPADGITEKVPAKLSASSANAGYYSYVAENTADTEDNTYTASIDNTNYEIAGGAMLIISKIDPLYTAPTANVLVYNDEWQELITAGEAIGGTMKYSLAEDGDYEESIPTGMNAGDYTVWFKVFGDENHNDTEPQSVIVTIEKADPIIKPVPRAIDLVYSGYPKELVARGRVYGGELLYSLSEDGPYSTDVPTGTEVGSYTVWYMVIGDSNHNDIAPQSIEATIAQKNLGNDPGNEPDDDPGNDPGNDPSNDPSNKPGNDPSGKPGSDPSNKPGDTPGSDVGNGSNGNTDNNSGNGAGGNQNSSLTSPNTGAEAFISMMAILILSMLAVCGMNITSLRKGKRNE